jgi:hypothetical protein
MEPEVMLWSRLTVVTLAQLHSAASILWVRTSSTFVAQPQNSQWRWMARFPAMKVGSPTTLAGTDGSPPRGGGEPHTGFVGLSIGLGISRFALRIQNQCIYQDALREMFVARDI